MAPVETKLDYSLISCALFVSSPWSRTLGSNGGLRCNSLRFQPGFEGTFPWSLEEVSGAPFLRRGQAWAELRRLIIMAKRKGIRCGESAEGRTLYKRKGKKVRPAEVGYENGEKPKGDEEWRKRRKEKKIYEKGGQFQEHILPMVSKMKQGERLCPNSIKMIQISTDLWPNKRDLLMEVLHKRVAGIAFDSSEKGRIHDDIEPSHIIFTVPHKLWQAPSFRSPVGGCEVCAGIIPDRLQCSMIGRSFGPYRNPWFQVDTPGFTKDVEENLILNVDPKPIKHYRLINSAKKINAVSIRNASLALGGDELSERFAGYPLILLINLFSTYDQYT